MALDLGAASQQAAFLPSNGVRSWGRVVRGAHSVARPRFRDELGDLMQRLTRAEPGLARGWGLSTGDACILPGGKLIDMTALDRFIAFDRTTGRLRAEAGMTVASCLDTLVPQGWFLSVVPGSGSTTLGGAAAADALGKNHIEAGSFGGTVLSLGLRRTDGSFEELAPGNPRFHATIGGLGLTGVIEWVEVEATPLRSTLLTAEDVPFQDIDDYFDLAKERRGLFESVSAWVDCAAPLDRLGRGVFTGAKWSEQKGPAPVRRKRPFDASPGAPDFMASRPVLQTLGSAYLWGRSLRTRPRAIAYPDLLWPADRIWNWNRLYGSQGFYRYQCVAPPHSARDACRALLLAIGQSRHAAFLGCLQELGPKEPAGLISFSMEGTMFSVDLPNSGERTLRLMVSLDAIVRDCGGRLNPSADARIPSEAFRASFPQWQEFKAHCDPGLMSSLWKRVGA